MVATSTVADGGGGGGEVQAMAGELMAALNTAKSAIQQVYDADNSQGESHVKGLENRMCTDADKARELFAATAGQMKGKVAELQGRLDRAADDVAKAGDAPQAITRHGRDWSAFGEALTAIDDKMKSMYQSRDRWQGMAGSSYWDKIPQQTDFVVGVQKEMSGTSAGLTNAGFMHYMVCILTRFALEDVNIKKEAAMSVPPVDNAYFMGMADIEGAVGEAEADIAKARGYSKPEQSAAALQARQNALPPQAPPMTSGGKG